MKTIITSILLVLTNCASIFAKEGTELILIPSFKYSEVRFSEFNKHDFSTSHESSKDKRSYGQHYQVKEVELCQDKSNELLHVVVDHPESIEEIWLLNDQGQLRGFQSFYSSKIDISGLKPGIYFVKLKTIHAIVFRQFVILPEFQATI
jgi:hypothetical protein